MHIDAVKTGAGHGHVIRTNSHPRALALGTAAHYGTAPASAFVLGRVKGSAIVSSQAPGIAWNEGLAPWQYLADPTYRDGALGLCAAHARYAKPYPIELLEYQIETHLRVAGKFHDNAMEAVNSAHQIQSQIGPPGGHMPTILAAMLKRIHLDNPVHPDTTEVIAALTCHPPDDETLNRQTRILTDRLTHMLLCPEIDQHLHSGLPEAFQNAYVETANPEHFHPDAIDALIGSIDPNHADAKKLIEMACFASSVRTAEHFALIDPPNALTRSLSAAFAEKALRIAESQTLRLAAQISQESMLSLMDDMHKAPGLTSEASPSP